MKRGIKIVAMLAVVLIMGMPSMARAYLITQLTYEPSYEGQPAWSPGGSKIAFVTDRDGNREIYVMDADGTNQRRLTYSDPGYGAVSPAWSPDGKNLLYTSVFKYWPSTDTLNIIDITSGSTEFLCNGRSSSSSWSPDENYIVFSECAGEVCQPNIYKIDLNENYLTFLGEGSQPAWSPDGNKIAFVSHPAIYIMNGDGTGTRQLTYHSAIDISPVWSPGGDIITFSSNRSGNFDIWIISSTGGHAIAITNRLAHEWFPTWSPDGTKIAFESDGDIWVAAIMIPADVDITPDTLNLASKGEWLTCYIWLPEEYDVADIEPNSIRLEGAVAADWMWFEEEEDEEEQLAMAKFRRSEVQEMLVELYGLGELDDVELTVSGELADETGFEGTDTIRVIDKGRSLINSNSIVEDGIEYYMQTDKRVYNLGENVEMLYRVTNLGHGYVKFLFSVGPADDRCDFIVEKDEERIWDNLSRPSFDAETSFTLAPSESRSFSRSWDITDLNGNQILPGSYDVTGVLDYHPGHERYVPVSVEIKIIPGKKKR